MKRSAVILILLSVWLTASSQPAQRDGVPVVVVDGKRYFVHTVAPGETLYGLSVRYNVPQSLISSEPLKAGQTLKIPAPEPERERLSRRKMQRTFVEHVVVSGETAYSIARNYRIPLEALMRDNPQFDPVRLVPGQVLLVRRRSVGDSRPAEVEEQIREYASALGRIDSSFVYRFVDGGATLYSLSREYGVTQDDLARYNDLSGGLRAGMVLRIPVYGKTDGDAGSEEEEFREPASDYTLRDYTYDGNMRIAMLLPLSEEGRPKESFAEFYRGALLALEDLKSEGYSLTLDLYDTERSAERVREITRERAFGKADLVIGPVYEENMAEVAESARRMGVPVVSPLAVLEGDYGKGVYQLAPDPAFKYDGLKAEFRPGRNIVLFTTAETDTEFESDMLTLIGDLPYRRLVYSKNRTASQIDTMLASNKDNLFVIVSGEEVGVDMILAAVSSVQNNRIARSLPCGSVRVVGSSRWSRYRNLEKNLLFKLGVSLVASYHADRSDSRVAEFDRRYISSFGAVPSLYSYRGYDAVRLTAGAMLGGKGPLTLLLNGAGAPLQTSYRFVAGPEGNTVNRHWPLVIYRSDYTISVH